MERFCATSQKLKDNLLSVPRSEVGTQSRLEGTVGRYGRLMFVVYVILLETIHHYD